MKPRFVFVHGWGFDAGIWGKLRGRLPEDTETFAVDLGFVRGAPEQPPGWPKDAIAVGHSLGVLWLLHHRNTHDFKALVSIQGFDRFCPHVSAAVVAGMRRGLARDPAGTLAAFWRAGGTEPFVSAELLDVAKLDEGLRWLQDWDCRGALAGFKGPVLALAAGDDAIVPPVMSESIWGDNIVWSETGGHVLPLSRPEWCAQHVLDFAHELEP